MFWHNMLVKIIKTTKISKTYNYQRHIIACYNHNSLLDLLERDTIPHPSYKLILAFKSLQKKEKLKESTCK
jgi:hypothetical protein